MFITSYHVLQNNKNINVNPDKVGVLFSSDADKTEKQNYISVQILLFICLYILIVPNLLNFLTANIIWQFLLMF